MLIKRIATLIVAAIFALTLMVPAAFATHKGPEHGNQTQQNTACTSPGSGKVIPGQGTTCQGEGLDQQTETTVGQGNAPPGQNK